MANPTTNSFLASLPSEGEAILVVTGNTDKTYYPERLVSDTTGQMETVEYSANNDMQDKFANYSRLKITLSNATEAKGATIYITTEDY